MAMSRGRPTATNAAASAIGDDYDPDVHDQDDLYASQVNGSAADVGGAVAGTYGSLTLAPDGSYTYAASKGALPAKIVAQDAFTTRWPMATATLRCRRCAASRGSTPTGRPARLRRC